MDKVILHRLAARFRQTKAAPLQPVGEIQKITAIGQLRVARGPKVGDPRVKEG